MTSNRGKVLLVYDSFKLTFQKELKSGECSKRTCSVKIWTVGSGDEKIVSRSVIFDNCNLGWLTRKQDGSYCKLCNTDIRSHRADLIRHTQTTKNKLQARKIETNQLSLQNFGVSVSTDALKRKEIILATYIAAHSSIRSIDHLTDILNTFSHSPRPGSASTSAEGQTFHLHKTKCAAIIRNVIAP
ncbi:unnamed protein product [Psylliodes chrysocephalus]|uniref:Uncharacterized protein n=1 Tax=Psylliodes chrysocephalus TaxID=3402493 RepID=A0A9P0GLD1_9CUCU|nr:unnamed protein product [Psylliodes chrysocephala]